MQISSSYHSSPVHDLFAPATDPIFSAALDGDLYQATMAFVSNAFPGAAVLIVGQDSDKLAGNFLLQLGGPPTLNRALPAELGAANGWLRRQWEMNIGRVYHDRDFASPDEANDGPLGRMLRQARPALDCLTGVVFFRAGTRQIALEVRYPRFREADLRPQIREMLKRLAEYLSLAVRIATLRWRVAETDHLASSLLDLLPFPTVLIDAEQRVTQLNGRAEAFVASGNALSIRPDGTLHLSDLAADIEFADLLTALRSSMSQRVALMSVPKDTAGQREILSVVRLSAASMIARGAASGLTDTCPRYAVICDNLAMPAELSHDVLWRLFGLSAKEADLAQSLLAGETIGDLAVRRKISKETLRNQLTAVMRKTDTSRQQDLVALLTRLATVNSTA